jgi:hypothetical protein
MLLLPYLGGVLVDAKVSYFRELLPGDTGVICYVRAKERYTMEKAYALVCWLLGLSILEQ